VCPTPRVQFSSYVRSGSGALSGDPPIGSAAAVSRASNLRRLPVNAWPCEGDRSRAVHAPNCHFQCKERAAWKRDIALEISVDVEHVPALILLSGTLDGDTAASLVALVAELIGEGYRLFELRTTALCAANEPGIRSLQDIHRLVRRSGGNVLWDGSTANCPVPAEGSHLDQGELGMRQRKCLSPGTLASTPSRGDDQ
jgi:hypothetical protein